MCQRGDYGLCSRAVVCHLHLILSYSLFCSKLVCSQANIAEVAVHATCGIVGLNATSALRAAVHIGM